MPPESEGLFTEDVAQGILPYFTSFSHKRRPSQATWKNTSKIEQLNNYWKHPLLLPHRQLAQL